MDLGLLGGTGGLQPEGIIDQAESVEGATLIAAVGAGIAEIGEAGGISDTIALSPTAYAAELTAEDDQGRLVHPDGLPDLFGLRIVQVPGLADPLLYDSRRCYLVLGHDSAITTARRLGSRCDDPERLSAGQRRRSCGAQEPSSAGDRRGSSPGLDCEVQCQGVEGLG